MIRRLMPLLLSMVLLLTGCAEEKIDTTYHQINAETARDMMNEQPEVVVLDVREPDEFENGHIPGAVLLPLDSITEASAAELIPTLDTTILVYCRSGNRSKKASAALADLGYTDIYEFGGINDWPYDVTD